MIERQVVDKDYCIFFTVWNNFHLALLPVVQISVLEISKLPQDSLFHRRVCALELYP